MNPTMTSKSISRHRVAQPMSAARFDALYTVQPADESGGLLEIARRIYGSADRWPTIYEANRQIIGTNPNIVRSGQQLLLTGLVSGMSVPGLAGIYVVEPDDLREGLAGIARRYYGDAGYSDVLYRINRGVIGEDPQRLQPGQQLLLLAP